VKGRVKSEDIGVDGRKNIFLRINNRNSHLNATLPIICYNPKSFELIKLSSGVITVIISYKIKIII
jgi:hypothetical protein